MWSFLLKKYAKPLSLSIIVTQMLFSFYYFTTPAALPLSLTSTCLSMLILQNVFKQLMFADAVAVHTLDNVVNKFLIVFGYVGMWIFKKGWEELVFCGLISILENKHRKETVRNLEIMQIWMVNFSSIEKKCVKCGFLFSLPTSLINI